LRHGTHERLNLGSQGSVGFESRLLQQPSLRHVQGTNLGLAFEQTILPRRPLDFTLESRPGRVAICRPAGLRWLTQAGFVPLPNFPQGRALGLAGDTPRSPRRRLGLDAAIPERLGERLPPRLQIGLLGIEALAMITERPDGQMDVRVLGVGVQGKDVVELIGKHFASEGAGRVANGRWVGSGRH
jgi:hypothetical protein